jgi:hypothetical protein
MAKRQKNKKDDPLVFLAGINNGQGLAAGLAEVMNNTITGAKSPNYIFTSLEIGWPGEMIDGALLAAKPVFDDLLALLHKETRYKAIFKHTCPPGAVWATTYIVISGVLPFERIQQMLSNASAWHDNVVAIRAKVKYLSSIELG